MASAIRMISSMATRRILQTLIGQYARAEGQEATLEAIGGVEAARRIRAGEAFDLVALAADALQKLEAEGFVAGARPFARSPMAIAIRSGAPRPDLGDEAAVKRAVAAAKTVGYSTGPSGNHLLSLLKRWGLDDPARIVQAPPGVPVATLVARGDAEIGFQQMSELLNEAGIEIAGPLPSAIQSITTFAIAIGAHAARPEAAAALADYIASPAAESVVREQGMEPG